MILSYLYCPRDTTLALIDLGVGLGRMLLEFRGMEVKVGKGNDVYIYPLALMKVSFLTFYVVSEFSPENGLI